uniref:Centromere protein M n=1 Tax=Sinocyclocheilus anshuiensis TaxID=1608454 RepID=A0A671KAQ1_9TELE
AEHRDCARERLARKLPLPVENKETRPRIDLIVFIVNLLSERSLQSVESSLAHLHSDCFLGKVCFLVTDAGRVNLTVELNTDYLHHLN